MTRNKRSLEADGAESGRPPKLMRSRYNLRSRTKRTAMLGGEQEGRSNLVAEGTHWDKMSVLKPIRDVPSKALQLIKEDFHREENGEAHHTDEYDNDDFVARRGQDWRFTMTFDRNVDPKVDVIVVQFAFGSHPKESKGTILRLTLNLTKKEATNSVVGRWSAVVNQIQGQNVDVTISTPPNAFVGKYGVFVETKLKNVAESLKRHDLKDKEVILLFNPWVKDDIVFMENEDERYEYVLNDHGRIWVGSAHKNSGRPWIFGQFDNPVLEAALYVMDKSEFGDSARKNPVSFVRAMSSLANSMDNNGVLEGRWTKKYPDSCTLPWVWSGSVKILKEFMEKDKPVQFGQCWVFSGLMTSLLRALGIPTRSVTNFESAHDTDSSMTIDSHFDKDGEPATWLDDSIWNFHVWNESFFRRTDLPQGYDGWQAHDATPQEASEGVMRCGPAPLKAIKEGHVYLNYDVPFIFSEVNGDKITWELDDDGVMKVLDIDRYAVGKCISTKAVGSIFRQDLTLAYKYPEGSDDERRVVRFVNQFSTRSDLDIYDQKTVKDVNFVIQLPESAEIGKDFEICLKAKNTSNQPRHVKGRLTVMSSYYTGVPGKKIIGQSYETTLAGQQETCCKVKLTSERYLSKLNPEATMQIYSCFKVAETEQQFCRSLALSLEKPLLKIHIPGQVVAKKMTKCYAEFANPLTVALTKGFLDLEGGVIISKDDCKFSNAIKPGETIRFDFDICPRRAGVREVTGTFTSDQLSGVDGSVEFKILPASR